MHIDSVPAVPWSLPGTEQTDRPAETRQRGAPLTGPRCDPPRGVRPGGGDATGQRQQTQAPARVRRKGADLGVGRRLLGVFRQLEFHFIAL